MRKKLVFINRNCIYNYFTVSKNANCSRTVLCQTIAYKNATGIMSYCTFVILLCLACFWAIQIESVYSSHKSTRSSSRSFSFTIATAQRTLLIEIIWPIVVWFRVFKDLKPSSVHVGMPLLRRDRDSRQSCLQLKRFETVPLVKEAFTTQQTRATRGRTMRCTWMLDREISPSLGIRWCSAIKFINTVEA